MKNKFLFFLMISLISISRCSYANWFQDIIDAVDRQGNISSHWLSSIDSQQRDLLASQKEVQSLMKDVNSDITGNYGWGNYQFHDYQSYGDGASNWTSVMQMAKSGGSGGELGQAITSIANQFPIKNDVFDKGVTDSTSRNYYSAESKTILVTRAASQLDYDKVQNQIAYQQMLQQQIEKTKDLKAAVDLNNRIQVENNLISLEILRQSAISNQQQAISEQANLNNALSNARFLIKQ